MFQLVSNEQDSAINMQNSTRTLLFVTKECPSIPHRLVTCFYPHTNTDLLEMK